MEAGSTFHKEMQPGRLAALGLLESYRDLYPRLARFNVI